MKNQVKSIVLKAVSKAAKNTAVKSANTACDFYQHQAVLPVDVKKLRKF